MSLAPGTDRQAARRRRPPGTPAEGETAARLADELEAKEAKRRAQHPPFEQLPPEDGKIVRSARRVRW